MSYVILFVLSFYGSINSDPIPRKYFSVGRPHCDGLDYIVFAYAGKLETIDVREGRTTRGRSSGTWHLESDTTVKITIDEREVTYRLQNYDSLTLLIRPDFNMKEIKAKTDSVLANDKVINELTSLTYGNEKPKALKQKQATLRNLKARAIADFFCKVGIRDIYVSDRSEFIKE